MIAWSVCLRKEDNLIAVFPSIHILMSKAVERWDLMRPRKIKCLKIQWISLLKGADN